MIHLYLDKYEKYKKGKLVKTLPTNRVHKKIFKALEEKGMSIAKKRDNYFEIDSFAKVERSLGFIKDKRKTEQTSKPKKKKDTLKERKKRKDLSVFKVGDTISVLNSLGIDMGEGVVVESNTNRLYVRYPNDDTPTNVYTDDKVALIKRKSNKKKKEKIPKGYILNKEGNYEDPMGWKPTIIPKNKYIKKPDPQMPISKINLNLNLNLKKKTDVVVTKRDMIAQNAKTFDFEKHNPVGWLMSNKRDGLRGLWDGKNFYSRAGNKFSVPKEFKKGLPPFPLDGELWIGYGKFEETMSVVKRKDYSGDWRKVKYMVFDTMYKSDLAFVARMKYVKKWFDTHNPSHAKIVKQIMCTDKEQFMSYFQFILNKGGEGIMLRMPDAPYFHGRSNYILKVKPTFDDEAIVIGYVPGKNVGKTGSLKVQLKSGIKFKVAGMPDKYKINPPPLGTVITFTYKGLTKNGIPRHSAFLRVRPGFEWKGEVPKPKKESVNKTRLTRAEHDKYSAGHEFAPKWIEKKSKKKKVDLNDLGIKETKQRRKPIQKNLSFTDITIKPDTLYRFEFSDDASNKFWEVRVRGNKVMIKFGKIGTYGRFISKTYANEEESLIETQKTIKKKVRKGYVLQ